MKWARIKPKNGGQLTKQQQINDQICYKDFRNVDHLTKTFGHKKCLWAEHPFEYDFGCEDNFKRFQKRYEIFCGGYLYFYDNVVRSKQIDHTLYFKWRVLKGKNKYSVGIYLNPAPLQAKEHDPHSKRLSSLSVTAEQNFPTNGKMALQTEGSTGNGGTSDSLVDPPKPPAPPPPNMQE